jgi:hypothetical protein
MTQPKSGNAGQSAGGGDAPRRTARRRTVLNLGMPFLQVDDFVNQSEDAVALGYKVLVETVEEIRKGYAEAKAFYDDQKAFEQGFRPTPPPIPWEQLVERLQQMQTIGLNAVKNSTDIFLDSMKAGMTSTKRFATTWAQSRDDLGENPVLAGPIFEEVIEVTAKAGDELDPSGKGIQREISHRGLMRLRIDVMKPQPKALRKPGEPAGEPELFRGAITARFDPSTDPEKRDRDYSVLDLQFGPIPGDQAPGVYEGLIRASNFELLIARLRINVLDPSYETPARGSSTRKARVPKK